MKEWVWWVGFNWEGYQNAGGHGFPMQASTSSVEIHMMSKDWKTETEYMWEYAK